MSNEYVICNFKVVLCFECSLIISVNRMKKKRGDGGGKYVSVYKMIYWEDKYMDYIFYEIFLVDKI